MREFPEEAGYAVGGDYEVKYYMIQMHYDNPNLTASTFKIKSPVLFYLTLKINLSLDRRDSSGIRFYLGNTLRKYDLGFLTLGTASTPAALAIPPRIDRFVVDSYCPSDTTQVEVLKTNT